MSNLIKIVLFFGLLITGVLYISACQNNVNNTTLEDSIAPFMELQAIEEASNTTMTVNRGETKGLNSYFAIDLSNIQTNGILKEGLTEAWCLEWDKPIRQDNDVHAGVSMYNTYGSNTWKPANYLMNIKDVLQAADSELTYREIQVALWSLIETPRFNLDEVLNNGDMPQRLMKNGQPNFSVDKVKQIVKRVHTEVADFEYRPGTPVLAYADTGNDQQGVGVLVGDTMFAYGDGADGSFRCNEDLNLNRWGWVFEYDLNGGEKIHDFIAGAGNENCDPYDRGGELVGELIINYEAPILSLNYVAGNSYKFSDPHIWVGCSRTDISGLQGQPPAGFPYPLNFDDDVEFTDETFEIDISNYNCSGSIFISAHAGNG